MRVLVCGGRDYDDREAVFHELHALAEQHGWLTIIEGGAKGADRLAREWAKLCYHGLVTVEAEWDKYRNAAGPIRNTRMIESAKPDLGLAFPSPLRGLRYRGRNTGTGDMVEKLRAAGIPVKVIGLEQQQEGLGLT